MADIVKTQTIINGKRNLVVKAVDLSDGTGVANYPFIQAATFGIDRHASIWSVALDVRLGRLQLLWGGAVSSLALVFSGQGSGNFTFAEWGGIYNDATSPTGDLLLTFDNAAPGSSFMISVELKKNQ